MPETFGKRMRKDSQAKKAAAREERRVARNVRKEQRAAGEVDPMDWLAVPEPEDEPAPLRRAPQPAEGDRTPR